MTYLAVSTRLFCAVVEEIQLARSRDANDHLLSRITVKQKKIMYDLEQLSKDTTCNFAPAQEQAKQMLHSESGRFHAMVPMKKKQNMKHSRSMIIAFYGHKRDTRVQTVEHVCSNAASVAKTTSTRKR